MSLFKKRSNFYILISNSILSSTLTSFFLALSILNQVLAQAPKVETKYDAAKDETTVTLAPIKLGGVNGKYYSLHSLVSFSYPGQTRRVPDSLTFELQTVVKGRRLKVDLYVQLLIDGEKIFLSSNRRAQKNPIPGKPWVGERIAMRMPYDVFCEDYKGKRLCHSNGRDIVPRPRESGAAVSRFRRIHHHWWKLVSE